MDVFGRIDTLRLWLCLVMNSTSSEIEGLQEEDLTNIIGKIGVVNKRKQAIKSNFSNLTTILT